MNEVYTREIQPPRASPVENGVPLQGTWLRAFKDADLSRVLRPYPAPLPGGIKGLRIKEWESFIIQDDSYYLKAQICNLKFYRTAQVVLYFRESGEYLEFRKVIPGGGWRFPRELSNASVDSRSWGFFFRIHSWLDTDSISLELNVEATLKRPAFTAYALFDLAGGGVAARTTPMAVSLLFSERRSMYAYKVTAPVSAHMVSGGKHIHLDPSKTSGVFCDYKGYYPYRMRSTWCTGMGFVPRTGGADRRLSFALGENQAREPYGNNENALWVDGRLTPLPPVKITRAGGPESNWIIQDMEGMVDLVFTPQEMKRRTENFVFSAMDYENPLGYFNGLLVSAEGEELPVRNVWGTGEKLYLRV